MTRLSAAILDDVILFCERFRIGLFDHQREALAVVTARAGGRFRFRLGGVSWPRGDGKSVLGAVAGLWRLVAGPPRQDIVSVALDVDGAKVVLDHASTIVRRSSELDRAIEIRANALLVPATGSRWTVASREHTSSRGRHPNVVIYDEIGWARDDDLFSSLLAGQASVLDPLMLVLSTVGRRKSGPLWTVKTLAESGDPSVCWLWSGANRSPKVTPEFLERQRRILLPAQFAREHQNQWVDAADAFTNLGEVDGAMSQGWTELVDGRLDVDAVAFVDLGTVRDPSVIAVGFEEGGRVYIGRLLTFQGSHSRPVRLSDVEDAIRDLARRWRLRKIRIESWQGIASAQRLEGLGLPVEVFAPTAKAHAEEWPVLAQRLASRTILLPPHARLRDELLNLTVEIGPQGARVLDKGEIHQDHAVAVRGVVAMLATSREPSIVAWARAKATGDPQLWPHPLTVPTPDPDPELAATAHQTCRLRGTNQPIQDNAGHVYCQSCGLSLR